MVDINTITNIEDLKNNVDYAVTCANTGCFYIMNLLGDTKNEDEPVALTSKQYNYRHRHLYLVDYEDECAFIKTRLLELIKSKMFSITP